MARLVKSPPCYSSKPWAGRSFRGRRSPQQRRVNLTLPAAPGTGLRFRRVDLDGQPDQTRIGTSPTNALDHVRGSVKVHDQHVLAAFAECGIDSAVISLDANEPPIADGSAGAFGD